jgi:hypothetical protein
MVGHAVPPASPACGRFLLTFQLSHDLQDLQGSHEGTEGPYLPQEAKVEMPEVRKGADAEA